MSHQNLKHSDLINYEGAAAGHDGVLSSSDGDLVIKPCTPAEIAFYQLCIDQDEPLYDYMPHFMGTLKLSTPEQSEALKKQATDGTTDSTVDESASHAAAVTSDGTSESKGKKLETKEAIVLENIAAGFVKPNILDLKLGAKLWADDAPPSKRQRMDDVSGKTTSGSLGFRIAGMRVWKADIADFKVYDKTYGRQLNAQNVKEGFQEYFGKQGAKHDLTEQEKVLPKRMMGDIERIRQILNSLESRMIGASILMVYEGDDEALSRALEFEKTRQDITEGETDDDGDGDEDSRSEEEPQVCRVALIDFAHSSIIPGQGRDENVLRGIDGALTVLEEVCK